MAEDKNHPSVFIGSSLEGLRFARAIRLRLEREGGIDVLVWEDMFDSLSDTFIGELTRYIEQFDFAVLIFTPDDQYLVRDEKFMSPRDNVLFELGLFMGRLGPSRTFIVHQEGVKIPSDLAGVLIAKYIPRSDNRDSAAVAGAGDLICTRIRALGVKEQTEKLEQDIQRISSEMSFLYREYIADRELSSAVSAEGLASTVKRALQKGGEFLHENPSSRRITILMSRVYFEKVKDRAAAISILTKYIEQSSFDSTMINLIQEERRADLAHAHYNRACYYVNVPDTPDYVPTESEIKDALLDLKTAVNLESSYHQNLTQDPDLRWLQEHEEFRGF
jgi:predicted nucleotide-binding protein